MITNVTFREAEKNGGSGTEIGRSTGHTDLVET